MDEITEQKIKDATDIVAVIGDWVKLRRTGVEYVGLCPFHNDHTPTNFKVSPSKKMYKCFACGAGGDAISFLQKKAGLDYPDALRYLAQKFSVPIPDDDYDRKRFEHVKPAKPLTPEDIEPEREMLVMSRDVVKATRAYTDETPFVKWLRELPWDTDGERERLEKMLWLYCVGGWKDGRVCFWYIDEQGRPRGGKLMRYGPDGKRIKTENPGWMHWQRDEHNQPLADNRKYSYRPTLFGLHLTKRFPGAIIHLVESEKTALICAAHYGNPDKNLWLACGGLKFLKPESMIPLFEQERTIYLWPDKDGLEAWDATRNTIVDMYHPKAPLQMSTDFLTREWKPEDGEKADVADVILRIMQERPAVKVVDWEDGPPFISQDELNDPDLHRMREILRRRYNFNKTHLIMPAETKDAESVAEVLQRHPILKKLF